MDNQPPMSRNAKIVIAVSCLLFLALRLAITFTAVDRIMHAALEEQQIAGWADSELHGGFRDYAFVHLWGYRPTIWAVAALLKIGLSQVAALKGLALIVSFLGFFSAIYLTARSLGARHAGVLAALLIFPNPHFLKWSLVTWGGYPEAASLAMIPILFIGLGLNSAKTSWFVLSGIAAGLTISYSPSVLFVPLAMLLIVFLPLPLEAWPRRLGALVLGMALGLLPLAWWLAQSPAHLAYETNALGGNNPVPIPYWQTVDWPSWVHLRSLWHRLNATGISGAVWEVQMVFVSVAWLILHDGIVLRRAYRLRWRLIFPLSLLAGALMVAMFRYSGWLEPRHVLWLFPAGSVCIAFFIADRMFPIGASRTGRVFNCAEIALKLSLLALVLIPNISAAMHVIRPREWNMLANYRGRDYATHFIFNIQGAEVFAANCVFDRLPRQINERTFASGFAKAFLMTGDWNDFLLAPYRPTYGPRQIRPPAEQAGWRTFFNGLGCAIAAKRNTAASDLSVIGLQYGAEAQTAATEGYTLCGALDCLPAP